MFLALLTSGLLCLGAVEEWQIDQAHSKARFSVRHMMVTTVWGQFGSLSGTVHYDPANPAASSVQAEVDAATIDTQEAKRDRHLKSADFFDVEKFPKITFKSAKVENASSGKLKVTGDLTMHGVTRPVVFQVDGLGKQDSGGRMNAVASAQISRKEFGMTWNRVIEAGGVSVSDEVNITIDVALIRRPSR